jgi:hypothetical protein
VPPITVKSGAKLNFKKGLSFPGTITSPAGGGEVTRQDDLIHWWKFDETSGATAADSVGGVELTLDPAPSYVAGKNGNALDFDGVDDMARSDAGAITESSMASGYTLASWVYFDAIVASYQSVWHLEYGSDAFHLLCALQSTHHNIYHAKDVGNAGLWGLATFAAGQWYHIAQTWDGSTVRLYSNAVELKNIAASTFRAGDLMITIGRYQNAAGAYSYPVNGKIDDFRIYDVALSASEVGDAYGSGSGDWG